SNVANIGLILGITAILVPLKVQLRLIRREVPFLLIVTALYMIMAWGGYNRAEGIFLLLLTAAYLWMVVRWAFKESSEVREEFDETAREEAGLTTALAIGFILLGGLALALGADLLVGGSVELAARMGVSEALIGLTIVAIGTSLPELAASIAAVRAGHADICAGNIVGSNLFNILLIGGGTATIIPFAVDPRMLVVEFPALMILSALLLNFFKSGHIVSRREGVCLLLLYVVVLSVSGLSQQGYLF
ncbi:MAG: sodium:calcium antiporter, partial [Verrucomicrobiota bacterium]